MSQKDAEILSISRKPRGVRGTPLVEQLSTLPTPT